MKNIIIIGSGIAGLSCAIQAAESGNKAILVSPYPSERAQSVMAAGGINAALNTKGEQDSINNHIEDTLKGGCHIESRELVADFCQAAPGIIKWLEELGMVFTRDSHGNIDLRAFGGQSHKRTAFSGACTGKQIVTALVKKSRQFECSGQLERKLGLWFHSGLIKDGKCFGALFYNERKRTLETIYGDAVVMATGGQNQLFGKTTGSTLCDGYATGKLFEQGAILRNLEFIQYHPTTIETPQKRMLITEGARGEGGRLFYCEGEKRVYFMEEKYGERGNLMPRDIVSKCIYDAPSQVYLDVSFLGKDVIFNRLSEVYDLCQQYAGIDITKECIPVYPSVHFFMGGLAVDGNHRTNIHNLYAIGECASLYHGANRLGGNSLLAAIYSGIKAATTIENTKPNEETADFTDMITRAETELQKRLQSKSKFSAVYIKQELADLMNKCLGITRQEEKLRDGIESIDYYLSISDKLKFDSEISPYQGYSLKNMLLLSKAILLSANERKETRGAHIREDYPGKKKEFECASYAEYKNGTINITFQKEESHAC